jgi:predicted alpha/beta hydrolase family esterase
MKNAIILHGKSSTPKDYWYPSIKKFLEEKGYSVWAPQLPSPDSPDLEIQLPFVLTNGNFNEETILIGHSAGCPLILSVLENLNVKINKAILVSGYARMLETVKEPFIKKIVQETYNWVKIKNNVQDFIFVNSENDPWGCNDKEGKYMQEHLGGKLIINKEGHMGSRRFNQSYVQFPLIEQLLS